jgi:hypothetical protein
VGETPYPDGAPAPAGPDSREVPRIRPPDTPHCAVPPTFRRNPDGPERRPGHEATSPYPAVLADLVLRVTYRDWRFRLVNQNRGPSIELRNGSNSEVPISFC